MSESLNTAELLSQIESLRRRLAESEREIQLLRGNQDLSRETTFAEWVANHSSAICVHDFEGTIINANPLFCELLDYRVEELIGRRVQELTGEISHETRMSIYEKLYDEGASVDEARYRRKDGSYVDAEVHASIVHLDGRRLMVDLLHDVTRRRKAEEQLEIYRSNLEALVRERTRELEREIENRSRAEEQLRREHTLLRTLIDNMPDYIYVKDRDGKIMMSNIAHARQFRERDPADMVGRSDFDYYPIELAKQYFADEEYIWQTGKPLIDKLEPGLTDSEGNTIWFSTTKMPLFTDTGEPERIVGISRNVTDRKHFEDALAQARDELRLQVEERTAALRSANERLEEQIDQLRFLNHTAIELSRHIELPDLYPDILGAFLGLVGKAEGVLCRPDSSQVRRVAESPAFAGFSAARQSVIALLDQVNGLLLEKPLIIRDWAGDPRSGHLQWPSLPEHASLIIVPLTMEQQPHSWVVMFTTDAGAKRIEHQQPLLMTLAAHAAVCLSNAVHYHELGQQARLEGELDAARNIQQSFMPDAVPPIPHVRLKGAYYPAFEVGGDYLDYFENDSGDWFVVVADVCGKGIPAALLMTLLRSTFRFEARGVRSARDLMCRVNDAMRENLDSRSFVTAVAVMIDRDGREMHYARAGHPLLLCHHLGNGDARNVDCQGIAMGLVPDNRLFSSMLQEVVIPLRKGDRFLAYTDGLTEATSPAKKPYGTDRLAKVLSECRGTGPEKIIESIMKDIAAHTGDEPHHDDLTMVAIEIA